MLRVLTLSTLYPDQQRPVLGPFVELQTRGLAALEHVAVQVVVPCGLPPGPLARHSSYRAVADLPLCETWNGLCIHRPRFTHLPVIGARFDAAMMVRALEPVMARIRRDFAFDIIDAEFFFPDGPAAIALGRAFGVPVSIKARGADIHYWGKRADTQRQVVSAGRAADGMLAVSSALKADMVALGMPEDKIAVHYTGIDRALFAPRDQKEVKAALEIAGKLIVSLGALVARKRHHIMIEAMSAIPDATLAIIGSGPEHDALAALARRLGVSDRVRLLGSLPRDQVAAWLAAADVMALAAASEGLANAWIEALASGAPVVTCNVGGAAEAIASPVAGQLVAPEPAAFVTAIREILVAPPPRAAVRACVDAFSWDANATALRDHLARLVTANRA